MWIAEVTPHRGFWHEITVLQLVCSLCCDIMWRLLLAVVLLGAVTVQLPSVTAVKGLMYMRQVDDTFDEFLESGDNVKVVYFCKGTWWNLCAVHFHTFSSFYRAHSSRFSPVEQGIPSLSCTFPPPIPLKVGSPPLRNRPLNPAKGSGECCKLPQWSQGTAPAEMRFYAFLCSKIAVNLPLLCSTHSKFGTFVQVVS